MKARSVLFVAAEFAPLAKVGGLGDVIGSLPAALKNIGIQVSVVIPRYAHIPIHTLERIGTLDAETAIYTKRAKGIPVFFIDNARYLSTGPIYFQKTAFAGTKKEIDRFVFFSRAVYQLLARTNAENTRNDAGKSSAMFGWKPDIVHCHDWHTALLVKKLRKTKIPVIYTIHNLANQGKAGDINWMKEGIKHADMVTTVSPTYAKEILTKKYGRGLEKVLKKRAREGKLQGILNGIDYGSWPLEKRNKNKFQKDMALAQKAAPVFGLVSRLTRQKGIRLLMPLVSHFVKTHGAQFVFLGQGEDEIEKGLRALARKHPAAVYATMQFDERIAHRIYAQSDFFLMPSRFEPSGLGQMIAMHYGTIPIVRATGGLKDSVKDGKTGLMFEKESSQALTHAIERALRVFREPVAHKKMMHEDKMQDFSWKRAAREYKTLYQKL